MSSDEATELSLWLRLLLTPGLGRSGARKLLCAFGLPEAIFSQPEPRLREVVSLVQARALGQPPSDLAEHIARTRAWLDSSGEDGLPRGVVTLADAHFPAPLLEGDDPPLMLWWCGQPGLDRLQAIGDPPATRWRSVAIVGTRNPTPQGAINARQFARSLAMEGLCVVSGLATGIDVAAHEGALSLTSDQTAGAPARHKPWVSLPWPTIAVVGTGLDRVYPRRNFALARQIADRGLLISEYPLGTPPLAAHFPQRNRLIAGLSLGTLVVEASLQSGSLITARLATELGREVLAIPGSIHSPQSRGCHALLREGARLVEDVRDVLQELCPGTNEGHDRSLATTEWPRFEGTVPMQADHTIPPSSQAAPALGDPLLQALGHDAVGIDELLLRTGLALPELQVALLHLELVGTVSRMPGGLYQRTLQAPQTQASPAR